MIIPHVEENMDRGGFNLEAAFPHQCPCCGQPTRVHETKGRDENGKERIIKTLFCDNATCETRKLKKFVHFVSKKAMNIEGCLLYTSLLNLRCGRRIGSICAPLNAGCLMNRLTHWALRVPHRLFYAGLLQNG